MGNIGEPIEIVEIPDPVRVPDFAPDMPVEEPAEPVAPPKRKEPVPV